MTTRVAILSGVLALAAVSPILVQFFRGGRLDLLDPPTVVGLFVGLATLGPLPAFVRGIDPLSLFWGLPIRRFESSLALALLTITLALCGFYFGFFFLGRFRFRNRPRTRTEKVNIRYRRLVPLAWGALVFSVVLMSVGFVLVGGLAEGLRLLGNRVQGRAGLNYFFLAPMIVGGVLLVWWEYIVRQQAPKRVLFVVYGLISFLMIGTIGNKSTLVVLALAMATIYRVHRGPIPAWRVVAGASIGIVGLLGYSLVAREVLVVGHFTSVDFTGGVRRGLGNSLLGLLAGDFFLLQVVTLTVDHVPRDFGFLHGQSLVLLPLLQAGSTLTVWAVSSARRHECAEIRSGGLPPPTRQKSPWLNVVRGDAVSPCSGGSLPSSGKRHGLRRRNT